MTEFEKLYEVYFSDVYRYLRKLTGDEDLAEEITAETFFRAMKALPGFRGECEVRVWLCQIAKNCWYSYLSKRRRTVPIEDEGVIKDNADIPMDERVIDGETVSEIARHMHGLTEPYKEVFMLRVYAEMDFASIGGLFGKSANWACVTYHRARKQIIEKIDEKERSK